ncbi:YezD family protein [Peribacillus frigoritolerans]
MDKENQLEEIFERLQEILNSMKYGSITLIVQDGKIIQMERNEKLRIK